MPQPFKNAVMTNAGVNLLTRAQFGEIQIEFTRIAIGNGVYEEGEKELSALQQQAELKSEKNSYSLSDIHIYSEKSIKITTLITNQNPVTGESLIEEGYYINEIGLYAKERGRDDSTEALYSICVTSGTNGDFMPPYNGFNPAQIIQDYYVTVNNSAEVTIKDNMGAPALADDLRKLRKLVEKQAMDAQESLQQQYEQLTGYTDAKIGQLINGAPETLDTIKEVADAILENETIVEALNEAVGKKLNKDGDLTDTTITFAAEDEEEPAGWKKLGKLVSGKLKDILNHVSIMSNNLKFLYKLCGTTDISGLADGTITGAVSMLNTGIENVSGIKYINFGTYDHNTTTIDGTIKDIFSKMPLDKYGIYVGAFRNANEFKIIIQSYQDRNYASAIVFSYAIGICFYKKVGGIVYKNTTNWDETLI